jgi:hypothetical protein
MSINEINAEAKESLRKYFKNSQDVKHENEARKELTTSLLKVCTQKNLIVFSLLALFNKGYK